MGPALMCSRAHVICVVTRTRQGSVLTYQPPTLFSRTPRTVFPREVWMRKLCLYGVGSRQWDSPGVSERSYCKYTHSISTPSLHTAVYACLPCYYQYWPTNREYHLRLTIRQPRDRLFPAPIVLSKLYYILWRSLRPFGISKKNCLNETE